MSPKRIRWWTVYRPGRVLFGSYLDRNAAEYAAASITGAVVVYEGPGEPGR